VLVPLCGLPLSSCRGPCCCLCCAACRTNFDCDNLEQFLNALSGDGSGVAFKGKREGGKEHPYSCVVLAGQRTMDERRRALQVSHVVTPRGAVWTELCCWAEHCAKLSCKTASLPRRHHYCTSTFAMCGMQHSSFGGIYSSDAWPCLCCRCCKVCC
jgi:hypothetical protein